MQKIIFPSQAGTKLFEGKSKNVDLGKAWEKVKADWTEGQKHAQELAKHSGYQPINEEKINQYHELKLSEND
jgi:hypothetical protein